MRVKITVAYNGAHFLGSQIQANTKNTVFGVIEHILKELHITSRPVASGRTDRGVHASGQVFHLDLPPFWKSASKLHDILNRMLPNSIRIQSVVPVSMDFHARFSAKKRVYRYVLKVAQPSPFLDDFVTFVDSFELQSAREKIALFKGVHDFAHFMKQGSDNHTTVREIFRAYIYEHNGYIVCNFEANGFLRTQIRFMMGALFYLSKEQIEAMLGGKKHKLKPAPSNGLYLARICY